MDSLELWISLAIPVVLIVVGRVVGASIERNHYRDIIEREARSRTRLAVSSKESDAPGAIRSASLAVGSVVVSVDHFKRFLSGFRMIFGGEVRSYSSLIDRARREAVLRMKESQPDADAYLNTRLETSTIASTSGNEGMGTIEVLAYGTAVHYDRAP
ncbi:MAG: YbjQ family protein [Deltaproteobacteria bacterium]|nr:YbjQ family protein [Deltaproteobacteria bacterium]NND28609.1 heavy metal-binding domain-containing protein [Myxococcales bacterium]MBT8463215.1 YbjQ family protein [Deltaproteobacteria bacterium]MBT8481353.1 YbjQ family protein [Deltaproteobacteria bacterium]NNK06971.1 heavy metal-binding domain-containing protein [Myxococcales bacterium]